MIIISDNSVKYLKKKFLNAMSNVFNGNHLAMFYLDDAEAATILGLIENYETRLQDGDYRAGMRDGYVEAKKDIVRKVNSVKLKLP